MAKKSKKNWLQRLIQASSPQESKTATVKKQKPRAQPSISTPKTDVHKETPSHAPVSFAEQMFSDLNLLARNSDTTIDIEAVESWMDKEPTFILDNRPPEVYRQGHLPHAVNVPLTQISSKLNLLPQDKSAQILTVCNSGNTSVFAAVYLRAMGYTNVRSLNGGVNAWRFTGKKLEQ